MFETFCLRLAAGLVLALLLLPARTVNPRFFRIHLLIGLGLIAAAGTAAWQVSGEGRLEDVFWLALGVSGGACLLGTWIWLREADLVGYAVLTITACGLLAALLALSPGDNLTLGSAILALFEHGTSAALLGIATTAMLMGHWYLIAPTMSLQPLLRLLKTLFAVLVLRLVAGCIPLAEFLGESPTFDKLSWLWSGLRWGAGILAPLVLTWMAWQAARIRSTQSATGILYVVVIFCFLGELTDQLLHAHWKELARGYS